MPELTLYKVELSPPANAVRTLAEFLGLKLNGKDVDFANLEHKSPEILKINPVGTIPILIDGDFVLTDSHAQLKYLITKYGKPEHSKLYPSDVKARAIVDQALFLDAAVLFIRLKVVALPSIMEDLKGPTPRQIKDIEEGYGIVEAYIAKFGNNKYVAADHLTIADFSLGSSIASTEPIHKLDRARFPLTAAWQDRLYAIPEFNKFLSVGVKIFGEALQAAWARNNA